MGRYFKMTTMVVSLLSAGGARATTPTTIIVDGNLSDFAQDEKTAGDPQGDSLYGANNDLSTLYVTWDANKLYLGLTYKAWNTGIMYLIETSKTGGVTNMCSSGGYKGAFPANLQGPGFDLMLAFFATKGSAAPVPYVYALTSTGSSDITANVGVSIKIANTANTTGFVHSGTLEVAIPWDAIYGLGAGKVPGGAKLSIAGVIRGEKDDDGLADVSPDPTGTVEQTSCTTTKKTAIDKLHQISIDTNADGLPESGWSPGSNAASSDGGVPDTGPAPDSASPDSGPAPDAVPAPDQAQAGDALPPDGTPVDSSAGDGGPKIDSAAGADFGPVDDAGADTGIDSDPQEEGCACSAKASNSGSSGLIALALLALVAVDRRRRR